MYQALRQHGAGPFDDVAAVVIERGGQLSVVDGSQRLDPEVFAEVVDTRRRRSTRMRAGAGHHVPLSATP